MKRDKITCPLMAQKCMFTPKNIEDSNYTIEELKKIYRINPDVFKRFLSVIKKDPKEVKTQLKNLLIDDWHLEPGENDLNILLELLGS